MPNKREIKRVSQSPSVDEVSEYKSLALLYRSVNQGLAVVKRHSHLTRNLLDIKSSKLMEIDPLILRKEKPAMRPTVNPAYCANRLNF